MARAGSLRTTNRSSWPISACSNTAQSARRAKRRAVRRLVEITVTTVLAILGAHARASVEAGAKGKRCRRAFCRQRTCGCLYSLVRQVDGEKSLIAVHGAIKRVHQMSPVMTVRPDWPN